MAQGPSANPELFSPPAPWGAAPPPTQQSAGQPPAPIVFAPFISSVSAVYTPTLVGSLQALPFIASVTALYTPIFSGSGIYTYDTSGSWLCPPGITVVKVEARAGGGGGGASGSNNGNGGGGGGAYAEHGAVPVTPGNTYTFTVGVGGAPQVSPLFGPAGPPGVTGGTTTFTGDGATVVAAVGGQGGNGTSHGAGGLAASSTGATRWSGGNGGDGVSSAAQGGGGGGEGAGSTADGHAGGTGSLSPGAGGTGGDGGDGGRGGNYNTGDPVAGVAPGGGGGGGGGFATSGAAGANGRIQITIFPFVLVPFIGSNTTVYTPAIQGRLAVPFIASATAVYTPTVAAAAVQLPFISSHTVVYAIVAIYTPSTGPGNGGETFGIDLAPHGTTVTAFLAVPLSATGTTLTLTSFSGLPAGNFCLHIDAEVMYVTSLGSGVYRIVRRGMSNTVTAPHATGAAANWTDSYDMAVAATAEIAKQVIYSVDGHTYDAWLIAFDSTQGYLGGSRYPMHTDQLLGVYAPGDTVSKLDGPQGSARHVTAAVSDNCPCALTVPARLIDDILVGDVALLRYTNSEASILTLGNRSTAIQSWYAFGRRDSTNHDVTETDPTGTVVDAAVDVETNNNTSLTTTMLGSSRTFTYGSPHYSNKGWPIGLLAVRHGTRRVPHWTSPDWHNFSYIYAGFGTDATYAQVVINRNGLTFAGATEESVALPGSQDITGPNVTWDDGEYYSSSAWCVDIFAGAVLFTGPPLNGPPPGGPPPPPSPLPGVGPGGSGDGGGTGPPITPPPPIEGGDGGGILPPGVSVHERMWASLV